MKIEYCFNATTVTEYTVATHFYFYYFLLDFIQKVALHNIGGETLMAGLEALPDGVFIRVCV